MNITSGLYDWAIPVTSYKRLYQGMKLARVLLFTFVIKGNIKASDFFLFSVVSESLLQE